MAVHHDRLEVSEPLELARPPSGFQLIKHPEMIEAAELAHCDDSLGTGMGEEVGEFFRTEPP
ncbi:MAG: hypothetical protein ACI8Y4_003850 [Candidatus Poriferisodalaceae bacterium]